MILYQTPVDTYGLLDKSGSLTTDLNLPHFLICETRFSVSRVSRSLNIQLLPSRGFSWAAPQTWWGSWHFTVTAPVWQEEEEQGAMLASCTPGDRHPTCPLSYVWLFTTGPQIGNWDEVAFLHSAIYKTFNQFLNQRQPLQKTNLLPLKQKERILKRNEHPSMDYLIFVTQLNDAHKTIFKSRNRLDIRAHTKQLRRGPTTHLFKMPRHERLPLSAAGAGQRQSSSQAAKSWAHLSTALVCVSGYHAFLLRAMMQRGPRHEWGDKLPR